MVHMVMPLSTHSQSGRRENANTRGFNQELALIGCVVISCLGRIQIASSEYGSTLSESLFTEGKSLLEKIETGSWPSNECTHTFAL
jgi:hypothetical protein